MALQLDHGGLEVYTSHINFVHLSKCFFNSKNLGFMEKFLGF